MIESDEEKSVVDLVKNTLKMVKGEEGTFAKNSRLFEVCSLISRFSGFEFFSPNKGEESLEKLCYRANARYRKIVLKGNWWEEDHGPFIGIHTEDKRPIAVLRESSGRYVILDPISFEKVIVDSSVASYIERKAYALYPSSEERLGGVKNLIKVFFKRNCREYTGSIILGIFGIILTFFIPVASKVIFDYVIPNYNFSVFFQVILGLILFSFSSEIFSFSRSILLLRLSGIISNRLQMRLWDRILQLPVNFFRSFFVGDIIQRTLVFDQIRRNFSQNMLPIFFNALFSCLYIVVMLYYSWRLTLISLAIVLFASLLNLCIMFVKIKHDRVVLKSNANIHSFLTQAIQGIEKIRTANIEKRVLSLFSKLFIKNQTSNLKSKNLSNLSTTLNAGAKIALPISLFAVVIAMRDFSPFSIGQYLAFAAAFSLFSQAVFAFLNLAISLVAMIPFWERIAPLLNAPVEKEREKPSLSVLQGGISIRNLFFSYQTSNLFVLENISLDIDPGEFIGIVGYSGSGKSTLCRLLIGFETPQKGRILYDDKELTQLHLPSLRNQISFLSHHEGIFDGTIYDNITCGRRYLFEEFERALIASTLQDDVKACEMSPHTFVSSRGGVFSGGQRQKLLLARSIIRNPKIMIFDEALNSLDFQTRCRVMKNLKSLGITLIVTAHDLSLFKSAQRIIVLEKGKMIAEGSFDDLADKEGIFQRFLHIQQL